ncbi:MAG: S1C family serine protease, partial [Acidimicrobiales bacterium]
SGGALADWRGQVVGINTAVAGIGLGLAVPIDSTTRGIIGALMSDGRVVRAYLGIAGGYRHLPPRLVERLERQAGVGVAEVMDSSPAAQAGLAPKDVILAVDSEPVETSGDLQRLMTSESVGRALRLRVLRDDRVIEVEVVPAELVE